MTIKKIVLFLIVLVMVVGCESSKNNNQADTRIYLSSKYYNNGGHYLDIRSDNLLELETNLTNGSYLKYLSLYDGNKVTSFSARVVNEADGIASLRVSQL